MFRVTKDYERVEEEPEPPPQPTPEIEIIPPSRRLQPAAVERLMAEVIEVEETPVKPKRRGIIISDHAPYNARSGFPLPCAHGYHGACSLCSARYA